MANSYTAKNGNTYVQMTESQFDQLMAQNQRNHEETLRMLREIRDLINKGGTDNPTGAILPMAFTWKMLSAL